MRGNLNQGKIRIRIPSAARLLIGAVEYLWVIFIILNGNSVYHANSVRNLYLLEIVLILTFLLLVLNFLFYRERPCKAGLLGAMIIAAYSTMYFSIMQSQMAAKTFFELFVLGAPMVYMLFAELYHRGRLMTMLYRFVIVICVLAVISLWFWTLGEVLEIIEPNGYVTITWGNFSTVKGYYGVHFAFQRDTTFFPNADLYRNSSIFSEAPMFNLWLNIALAIELFLKPKASKARCLILVATILTTLSVTGILFLVLCVVLRMLEFLKRMNRVQRCVYILVSVVLIPAMAVLVLQSMALKTDTKSYEIRLSDYVAGIKLWMDHPVFGSGFGNLKSLHAYVTEIGAGVAGFSNSVTAVLGTGGIWMALLYYIPHLAIVVPGCTGSKKIACFGVCMLYLFVTTIFFARFIGVMLIMFGYAVLSGAKNPEHFPENLQY